MLVIAGKTPLAGWKMRSSHGRSRLARDRPRACRREEPLLLANKSGSSPQQERFLLRTRRVLPMNKTGSSSGRSGSSPEQDRVFREQGAFFPARGVHCAGAVTLPSDAEKACSRGTATA